jgi:hypothetical protein
MKTLLLALFLIAQSIPLFGSPECLHSPDYPQLVQMLEAENIAIGTGIVTCDDYGFGWYSSVAVFQHWKSIAIRGEDDNEKIIDPRTLSPEAKTWTVDINVVRCPPWENPAEFWARRLSEDSDFLASAQKDVDQDIDGLKKAKEAKP